LLFLRAVIITVTDEQANDTL